MVPGGYIPPVLGVWSTPGTAICTVNGRRDSAMATSAHPPAATRSWLTNWVYPSPQRHHASLGMCRQPIWGGHTGKRWATRRELFPTRPFGELERHKSDMTIRPSGSDGLPTLSRGNLRNGYRSAAQEWLSPIARELVCARTVIVPVDAVERAGNYVTVCNAPRKRRTAG